MRRLTVHIVLLFTVSAAWSQQILDELQVVDISNEAGIRSTVIRDPEQALLIVRSQIASLRIQSNNVIYRSEQTESGTWQVRLAPGTHRISFQAPGFVSHQQRFFFNEKEVKGIQIRVIPAAERREEKNVGYIVIDSDPDSAQVYMNDQFYGTTPYMGKIVTGSYRLQLLKELYNVFEDTLVIVADKTLPVNVKLDPVIGSVTITSQPAGAAVEINGRPVGRTPLTYPNLELGTHRLTLNLDRYDTRSIEFTIDKENLNRGLNIILTEKRSYLTVSGIPSGSLVSIDGSDRGGLPVERVVLPYGYHDIKVSRPGFYAYEESIMLSKPEVHTVTVNLKPKSRTRATLYAGILPGSGQVWAGQTVKGILLGAGALGSLGTTLYLSQQYSAQKDQYYQDKSSYETNTDREKMEQYYAAMTASYDQLESTYDAMRIAAGVTIAVWVYNILDAYLFFPDQPGIRISGITKGAAQGLAVMIDF